MHRILSGRVRRKNNKRITASGQLSKQMLRLLLAYPVWASAQGIPADLIRQHERAVQDAQRRERPDVDVFLPDEAAPRLPKKSTGDAPCHTIRQIRTAGHPDAMGEGPFDYLATFIGRCLTADDINALLGNLNRWYQERGWTTTRVYATEQDLREGILELRVIPGHIEGYRTPDANRDYQSRFAAAFPGQPGDYLNLRDLEQGLENLNRLPSQDAKFKLYPGKEPGTSDVVIEFVEKPAWRVTGMLDNSGTQAMGEWRSNTELALDNPLGRNDQLAIGYNRNLDGGKLDAKFEGLTLNYLIPQGKHLVGVSASTYESIFTLPGINQDYGMRTHSTKAGLSYDYLIARSQGSKQSVIAGLDFTRQTSHIGDIEIESQYRRLSVLYLGAKGKHYVGNQIYDWLFRIDQGTGLFGAMGSIPGGSDPRYTLAKAQFSALLPLKKLYSEDWANWRTTLQFQAGNDKVPSLAHMYVGSRYNVRGFRDYSLYGATGAWWRNDLESKSLRWRDASISFYGGLDTGWIQANGNQAVSQHHLAGYALGVRGEIGALKADVAYSRAISRPDEFAGEAKGHWLAHLSIAI